MSKEADKGGFGARLWGTGREPQGDEKVLPLKPPPEARPSVKPTAPEDRAYVAFEVRDRATERLQIKRSAAPSRFPNYSYLLDISFDHHLQSAFTLIFTFMIVEVTGWNLAPIVHAIRYGNCEGITEFDARQHDYPAKDQPLIEKIDITTADEKLRA
jgi:hypothetical protein